MQAVQAVLIAIVLVGWIAYLVPLVVNRRRNQEVTDEGHEDFPDTMNVVSRGSCTVVPDQTDDSPEVELSTPYTRSYARRELRRSWASAAKRRMTTMLVLLSLTVLCMVLAILDVTPWWLVAVFALLLVGFFVLARWSVVRMAKRFDRRYALIDKGWDEDTIVLEAKTEPFRIDDEPTSWTIDLDRPVTTPEGSLWDDVVVTAPTYVSTPLSARTVRTIDLSAPGPVPGQVDTPVVAEKPVEASDGEQTVGQSHEGPSGIARAASA
ncbi:hypothetical protein O6R08_02185 [Cutibacterium equinum]|uniref:Tat pathway signal sequence domain protein n=1 Tax=Cutibacterium equinum TaxID=3016342 RepID=A0ABY7QZ90_9ACTN|nr:hypothetical protein [Cutibacterium equinum]WCC80364.1 hypothetical protein O6R08_02185 [Cutibacterium equinum]